MELEKEIKMKTGRTVTFSIKVNAHLVHSDAPLDIWTGILDLEAGATWDDVYQAIAMAYLCGGDQADYIMDQSDSQRWTD
jgi:hypothetical protein